ncbi:MAG: DUF1343 domain-containing protein [Myxococcales bacterium]|nr:DUF1343 domain-containing protein [Myxococcales bacterium]
MPTRRAVSTGLDRLLADQGALKHLAARRVGLLANPTSVTRGFVHAVDALIAAGVRPDRLFGPEHGVRGEAQDMIAVAQDVDPISGISTVSLYGAAVESLAPTPDQLDGLDLLLIDLQDVGSRYYTYVYTAMLTAEACTRAGVEVWVLDRPNPIAAAVEGPAVDVGFESFVGMLPLPNRHGLTLAEVLRFASRHGRALDARIWECDGWTRTLWADDHDAPWVIPSPNMPTLDTAVVYPGMCLLEGTNLSEGRGTTRPFELFGAPYVDARRLAAALDALNLPGVALRLASFEPTFQKWGRQRCGGLQLHVTDREAFLPLVTGAAVVWAAHALFPEFEWRAEAYEFVDSVPAIDLLFGSARPRQCIESGGSFADLRALLETPATTADEVAAARLPAYDHG